MDRDLQEALIAILKDSREFIITQAPEVFQQALQYNLYSDVIGIIVSLIVGLLSIVTLRLAYKETKKPYGEQNDNITIIGGIFGTIILTVSVLVLINNTEDLIKMKTAPKLYLYEKFKPSGCSK